MTSDTMVSVPSQPQLIESPKITDIHGLVVKEQDSERVAKKMLKGTFEEVNYEEYANLLGSKEMESVLRSFIVLLGPLPDSLLASLQLLVSKIYFVAEAQNIDRILEELSLKWVESHPDTLWESHYKLCHIVLFSLLILNSDLHNNDGVTGHAKFSSQEFVENTVYALTKEAQTMGYTLEEVEPLIEEQLASYYDALKAKSLPLLARPPDISRENSHAQLRNGFKNSTSRQRFSVRSVTLASLETTLSNETSTYSMSASQVSRKESNYTSNWKFHHNKQLPQVYCPGQYDAELNAKNGSSWFVDSVIKLCEKDLVSSKNDNDDDDTMPAEEPRRKDAKHFFKWFTKSKPRSLFEEVKSPIAFLDGNAKWLKARVRVSEGRIFVFRLKTTSSTKVDAEQDINVLKKNCSQYFVFNLFEAVANLAQDNVVQGHLHDHLHLSKDHSARGNFTVVVPSGLNGQRTTLEFQTPSVELAAKYVQCVNFWAARITTVPSTQFEVVTNEEYGWSERAFSPEVDREYIERANVNVWRPLLSIEALYDELQTIGTDTDLQSRLEELTVFTEYLDNRIDTHNDRKPKMLNLWGNTELFEPAMDNWNKKYLYLHEIFERSSKYLAAMQKAHQELPK